MARATVKLLACLQIVALHVTAIQVDVDTNQPIRYQHSAGRLASPSPSPAYTSQAYSPPAYSSPDYSPAYSPREVGKSYSHTFVASPGVRKYNYGISHDPAGRDFSIHFNPLDTDVDLGNYLGESPRYQPYDPQYRQYDRVQMNVRPPSYSQLEKASRAIQEVHTAYSNQLPVQPTASDVIIRSPKPMTFEEFDLGLMGYGDFMDSPDYDAGPSQSPSPAPVVSTPKPAVLSTPSPIIHSPRAPPIRFQPQVKFPQNTLKFPKSNNQVGIVPEFRTPRLHYGFKPIDASQVVPRKPSYTPNPNDERHLQDLADKAFSKVFMSHNNARNVPIMYSQTDHVAPAGLNMLRPAPPAARSVGKAVLVPVILIPGTDQVPPHGIVMSPYNRFIPKRSSTK